MANYPEYKGIVDFAQAIDDTYVRKDAPSVPVGGAKGEVLRKKSNLDGDAEWANPLYHFNTLAEMQAALTLGQIPDGANVSVEEELPGGNTGDTSLDTTSENWVQNKVVANAINAISSDLASKQKKLVEKSTTASFTIAANNYYASVSADFSTLISQGFKPVFVNAVTPASLNVKAAFAWGSLNAAGTGATFYAMTLDRNNTSSAISGTAIVNVLCEQV